MFLNRRMVAMAPDSHLTRLADEDLLTLVERQDADAFEALYDRHAQVAYSLAFRLVGSRTEAEDLVQESMLAIWRGAASYSPARGSVRTWLLSIVHNRGIDLIRRAGAATRRQEALEQIERVRPPENDTAALGVGRAISADVRAALADLPDDQVQVLKLAYYGGYTHTEISEMLDVPLGTIKSRMRLGLERLRGALGSMEGVEQ